MQVVTPQLISGKKVLLRFDLDVALSGGKVCEDFRLIAGLPTLELCIKHAQSVVLIGHLGRPGGKIVPDLSVSPVVDWLEKKLFYYRLPIGKLHILENLRFEEGEENCSLEYAQKLAKLGNFYINESFAAYREASSTTILPRLLPSTAGLQFAQEVERLAEVRKNPKKPLVFIIGGAKIDDKLPVVLEMSKIAAAVLVGGKLPQEIRKKGVDLPGNVMVARMNEDKEDITANTLDAWSEIINSAGTIVWNGPVGFFENPKNNKTKLLANLITGSGAETIAGGGDTVAALNKWNLLDKFSFVSTGGGAMLKLLETGTLPTIDALNLTA